MLFSSAEECNKLKSFAPEKNEENLDRLEEELKRMMLTANEGLSNFIKIIYFYLWLVITKNQLTKIIKKFLLK